MPKHHKMKARGGIQAAGVGADIGDWVERNLLSWLGLAEGGELADLSVAEKKDMLKEAKADLKDAIKMGEITLPEGVQSKNIGGDIGQWAGTELQNWIEDWLASWFGLARGGVAMARGGLARGGMARGGHSVFY
jgi:hypothetical protein